MALLNPAYKLTLGDRIVDTTDQPQASTVVSLSVALDMEAPADSCTLEMGQVGSFRPARGEEAIVELGYADNGGLTRVLSGTIRVVEPGLVSRRVVVHSAAANLLRSFADTTHENKTAGDIVNELAGAAGITVAQADAGLSFPAYVVDGRRSAWQHLRDLADLCGFDLYLNPEGELVFEPFAGGRTVHVFDYGRHVLALDSLGSAPQAGTVEAWGESPTGAEGEDAWGWLTKDFSGSKGSAGSGEPTLLLQRPVLRTARAAQSAADALHTELQRRAVRGRLLVLGNPAVKLGDAIRLQQNPETELNGSFQVRSVTHHISKARGFTTLIGFRGI